jgi:hypothetical protein
MLEAAAAAAGGHVSPGSRLLLVVVAAAAATTTTVGFEHTLKNVNDREQLKECIKESVRLISVRPYLVLVPVLLATLACDTDIGLHWNLFGPDRDKLVNEVRESGVRTDLMKLENLE